MGIVDCYTVDSFVTLWKIYVKQGKQLQLNVYEHVVYEQSVCLSLSIVSHIVRMFEISTHHNITTPAGTRNRTAVG